MVSSNPDITLQGSSIEDLKRELEVHLSRACKRQKPDRVFTSYAIPMGVGASLEPAGEYETFIPFSIAGKVSNFTSYVTSGNKDISFELRVVANGITQLVEKRFQDSFREYTIELNVPKASFVCITLRNSSKVSADVVIGFTFKEGTANEIQTLGLIGTM
jgi:hypothetical protein